MAAAVVTVLAGAARGKITALYLGADGIGAGALVLQWAQLAAAPAALAIGPAFITLLARAPEERRAGLFQQATTTAVLLLAVSALAAWLIATQIIPDFAPLIALATFGVGLDQVARVPSAAAVAVGDVRTFAWTNISFALVITICVAIGTMSFALRGQLAGLAVAPFIGAIATRQLWSARHPWIRFPRLTRGFAAYLRAAAPVGIAALASGLAAHGALLVMRSTLRAHLGDAANGQFQAAWAVGATYFGIVLQGLSSVLFPRFAKCRTPKELSAEVDAALQYVLRNAPPVMLAAVGLRMVAIQALYSAEFRPAADMLGYQASFDLCKAVGWTYGGALLYQGATGAFLLTEFIGGALLAGLTVLLVPYLGIQSTSAAYGGAYITYAIVTRTVAAKACGVSTSPKTLLLAIGTAIGLAAVTWLSAKLPVTRYGVAGLGLFLTARTPIARSAVARIGTSVAHWRLTK